MRLFLMTLAALSLLLAVGPVAAQDDDAATDEQEMLETFTSVLDNVTDFDQETLEAVIHEKATIVLSYMGVQVLDRDKFIEYIKYEDVSGLEFSEPDVTMFGTMAFVSVDLTVPGYADGVLYAVVGNMASEWKLLYAVIDPTANLLPTSRQEKTEALLEEVADDILKGLTDGSLEAITSRLDEDNAMMIAGIPPMTPMIISGYDEIISSAASAEPMLAVLPDLGEPTIDAIVGNGVAVGWLEFELPDDVKLRAVVIGLVKDDDLKITSGIVAFEGNALGLMNQLAAGGV